MFKPVLFSRIDVSKDTFLPLKIHQMLVSQFPQKMLPFYPFSLSQKVMQFHEKFKINQNKTVSKCELFELFSITCVDDDGQTF